MCSGQQEEEISHEDPHAKEKKTEEVRQRTFSLIEFLSSTQL